MSDMEENPKEKEVEVPPSPSLSKEDQKKKLPLNTKEKIDNANRKRKRNDSAEIIDVEDLTKAVAAGNKEAVKKALEEGGDALVVLREYQDYQNVNLICVAAKEGKAEVIEPLHSAGAQINHVTKNGFNAFHIAARYGYPEVINKLVELKINVNATTERGYNALHCAANFGQPNVLKALVNGGLNVNTFNKQGLNALHIAAKQGQSEVLSKLVPLGINVNAKSSHGLNALHIAAQHGMTNILSKLVNNGMNVNATTERGFNALHIAVQHCQPQAASALIRLGIGVNTVNGQGLKVVHLAARYGHSHMLAELSSSGMDVNAVTERGFNALHIAAQHDQPEIITDLVDLGMDIDKATRYGRWTPLHCAADSGNQRCVEELLKLGANKDALDNRQWTPLMVAEKKNQAECVKTLKSGGSHMLNDNISVQQQQQRHGKLNDNKDTYLLVKSLRHYSKGPVFAFNYVDFLDASSKRVGAESDSKSISDTFTNLGYDVHLYTNYKGKQTLDKFKDLQKDQTLTSLIIILLSHGTDRLTFKTSDEEEIDLDRLRQMFTDDACPTLKGRSKIFMANFCRGQFIEKPIVYDYDSKSFDDSKPKREAPHNMITIHAATEGIMAARHAQNGTIFIHCLCRVIKENPDWELNKILNELFRQMTKEGGTTPMQETFPPTEEFKF